MRGLNGHPTRALLALTARREDTRRRAGEDQLAASFRPQITFSAGKALSLPEGVGGKCGNALFF